MPVRTQVIAIFFAPVLLVTLWACAKLAIEKARDGSAEQGGVPGRLKGSNLEAPPGGR